MAKPPSKSAPTWTQLKEKLSKFDRKGLEALIHDLYAAHKDNQRFLHARFGLGVDALAPYKQTIARWVSPDVFSRNVDISAVKAKQAIADYKKAAGDPEGMAELTVFYCECATDFCAEFGGASESDMRALVQTFEQAVSLANSLPASRRAALLDRLDDVRVTSQAFGYCVSDQMLDILSDAAEDDD